MADVEVDLEIQRGETNQLSWQGPTAGWMRFKRCCFFLPWVKALGGFLSIHVSQVLMVCLEDRRQLDLQPLQDCTRWGLGRRAPHQGKLAYLYFWKKRIEQKWWMPITASEMSEDKWLNLSAQSNLSPAFLQLRRLYWGKPVGSGPNLVFSQIWFSSYWRFWLVCDLTLLPHLW